MPACAHCGSTNPPGARFCGQCSGALTGATAVAHTCADCGGSIADDGLSCPRCARHVQTGVAAPAGDEALRSGTVLAGRYTVVRALGRGGMGTVYEVTDGRLGGKRWALKLMTSAALDAASRASALEAFTREATLLAGLSHPNLPSVVDFFSENSRHCLVMEYVEGQTLEAIIRQAREPLAESRVVIWAAQVSAVLSYLHAWKPPIIFRDLKPSNVILLDGERIKLIDFGIARHFKQGKQHDTAVLGTHGFAAPESYGQGQSDARSDVYSLGATLYYLLTGDDPSGHPFVFAPLRRERPALSAGIAALVSCAVHINPTERFQSSDALRKALSLVSPPSAAVVSLAGGSASPSESTDAPVDSAPPTRERSKTGQPGGTRQNVEEQPRVTPLPPREAQSVVEARSMPPEVARSGLRCPRCAAPLPPRALFCGACGQPLSGSLVAGPSRPTVVLCTRCRLPLAAGARFCGKCGMPAPEEQGRGGQLPVPDAATGWPVDTGGRVQSDSSARPCPRCGRANPSGRRHCSGCGAVLPC